MKKYALAAAIALSASGVASAGEYQVELNGLYDKSKISNLKMDTWAIGGSVYLNAINDSKGPLAEAAFLNKASFLSAAYLDYDWKVSGSPIKASGDAYAFGGEYVIPGSDVILGANYSKGDIKPKGGSREDLKAYDFTLGKYLNDNTSLRLNYAKQEDDVLGADTKAYALDLHHLTGDLSGGMQLGLDAGVFRTTEKDLFDGGKVKGWGLGVGGDLYLNRQFSVGAGVDLLRGDKEAKGSGYNVRTQYFLVPQFAVGLGYSVLDLDKAPQLKGWTLGLTGRF